MIMATIVTLIPFHGREKIFEQRKRKATNYCVRCTTMLVAIRSPRCQGLCTQTVGLMSIDGDTERSPDAN
jgi:hypothetical protein